MVIDLGKTTANAVFCISPARAGTMYLADYLADWLPGWSVYHEYLPRLDRKKGVSGDEILGQLREKRVIAMGSKGYLETDHSFICVFSPYVDTVFLDFRVIHLLREPLRNAVSLHYTQKDQFFVHPNSEDDEISLVDPDMELTDFQRWVHHVYECHARGFLLRDQLREDGDDHRYYPFRFEHLSMIAYTQPLAQWVDPQAELRGKIVPRTNKMTLDDTPTENQVVDYQIWYGLLDDEGQYKVDLVNAEFGVHY